jgi:hypothetical protein
MPPDFPDAAAIQPIEWSTRVAQPFVRQLLKKLLRSPDCLQPARIAVVLDACAFLLVSFMDIRSCFEAQRVFQRVDLRISVQATCCGATLHNPRYSQMLFSITTIAHQNTT